MKRVWQDDEQRRRTIEAQKASHKRPEVKASKSAASKKAWTPERRAAHGAKCRATLARKKFKAAQHTENNDLDAYGRCDNGETETDAGQGLKARHTERHGEARAEDGDAAHKEDRSWMIPSDDEE